jgi:uncharacterized protein (TIGR02147 family)
MDPERQKSEDFELSFATDVSQQHEARRREISIDEKSQIHEGYGMADSSYRQVLKDEYTARTHGKSYSLRSFARDLDIDPAQMWRVLSFKQHLSPTRARHVATHLFQDERRRDWFVALAELELSSDPQLRAELEKKIHRLAPRSAPAPFDESKLQALADWRHVTLLALMGIDGFTEDHQAIATRLECSRDEVGKMVNRLIDAGLVNRDPQGKLVKESKSLVSRSELPSHRLRLLHKQFIQKGMTSLDEQPLDRRHVVSKTLSFDAQAMPRFKALVRDFFRDVSDLAAGVEHKSTVYQLNLQMFDLLK